ncbi:hypothetical protein D9758_007713 [Tetrapyrgos nigripes]|uniref:DUF7704 domain-containing protein n=1 Tax=Tetrapyrgos nigripes TaxID=182062 RepID=A0A8H5G5J5_9AGAR|nr:hypothetical protein D9758_007713 [Tetrapyrgos nigripes]
MSASSIPWFYKLFLLYIEPVSALAGAYYAALRPSDYLRDLTLPQTSYATASDALPNPALSPEIAASLFQLANLYLLFALNEHLVLSSTNSLTTWRRLLFCLLVADFGHLATLVPLVSGASVGSGLGWDVYYRVWDWNAMMWGSIGFVYLGASTRIAFLLGVGLQQPAVKGKKRA